MRWVAHQDRLVGVDGLPDVAEARLVDVAEANRQGELGSCVVALLGELDLRVEEPRQLLVHAFFLVELREKGHCGSL